MLYYHLLTSKDKGVLFRKAKQCKICAGKSGSERLVTDHCHTTGIVRGILCEKCNSWLGKIEGSKPLQERKEFVLKLEKNTKIPAVNFLFYLDDFRRAYIKTLYPPVQLSVKLKEPKPKETTPPIPQRPKEEVLFSITLD